MNVTYTLHGWVNVYRNKHFDGVVTGGMFRTKEDAIKVATTECGEMSTGYIRTIEIGPYLIDSSNEQEVEV